MDPNDPVNQENAALDRMINGIFRGCQILAFSLLIVWMTNAVAACPPLGRARPERVCKFRLGLAEFAAPPGFSKT
jgi:hypothetical protein